MLVSLLPFPTKLIAEAIHDHRRAAAVIFYGLVLLSISVESGCSGATWPRTATCSSPTSLTMT